MRMLRSCECKRQPRWCNVELVATILSHALDFSDPFASTRSAWPRWRGRPEPSQPRSRRTSSGTNGVEVQRGASATAAPANRAPAGGHPGHGGGYRRTALYRHGTSLWLAAPSLQRAKRTRYGQRAAGRVRARGNNWLPAAPPHTHPRAIQCCKWPFDQAAMHSVLSSAVPSAVASRVGCACTRVPSSSSKNRSRSRRRLLHMTAAPACLPFVALTSSSSLRRQPRRVCPVISHQVPAPSCLEPRYQGSPFPARILGSGQLRVNAGAQARRHRCTVTCCGKALWLGCAPLMTPGFTFNF